jgi:hypothetical protein
LAAFRLAAFRLTAMMNDCRNSIWQQHVKKLSLTLSELFKKCLKNSLGIVLVSNAAVEHQITHQFLQEYVPLYRIQNFVLPYSKFRVTLQL